MPFSPVICPSFAENDPAFGFLNRIHQASRHLQGVRRLFLYLTSTFHSIHQNPIRANLVDRLENWKWSSLSQYRGRDMIWLCKKEIAYKYVEVNWERLLEESYSVIPEEKKVHIL